MIGEGISTMTIPMERRSDLILAAKRLKDCRFCSVVAVALLTDSNWDDAQAALELHGRPYRRGARMDMIWGGAFNLLGFRGDLWARRWGDVGFWKSGKSRQSTGGRKTDDEVSDVA